MNIRSLLLSSVATVALVVNASAADLPVKAVPIRPAAIAPFSWTGLYIGGFGGASFANNKTVSTNGGEDSFVGPANSPGGANFGDPTTRGLSVQGLVGGTIGYNYQFPNMVVVGLEADGAWLSKPQSHTTSNTSPYTFAGPCGSCGQGFQTGKITNEYGARSIGTVRGRLGYGFDRALVFVTGGFAFGQVKSSTTAQGTFNQTLQTCCSPLQLNNGQVNFAGSSSKTKTGYALGGGFEYALTHNLIAKFDALYYNLGKVSTTGTGRGTCNFACGSCTDSRTGSATPYKATHTVDGVMTRVGLNYKF
jgi:outer membrane immunogenic protein